MTRVIQASVRLRQAPAPLWKSITEHESLPQHTAFLRKVSVLERRPEGIGTVRQCTLASGKSFTERITAWEAGRLYCYSPDTSQGRWPFNRAEACWNIEPQGQGSRLTYRLEYEPKSMLKDWVNYPIFKTYGIWQIKKMLRSYDLPAVTSSSR